jgi:hypothetical protein
LLIEPKAERVHQNGPQHPIAQMPKIPCPHALEMTPVGQLSKDGIDIDYPEAISANAQVF